MKLDIKLLNDKLEQHDQKSRISFYSAKPKKLILNNIEYIGNAALKILRRINSDELWMKNFDRLYLSFDVNAEKQIKSMISAKGGRACQSKHRTYIKKNLNTGTPWNSGLKGNYPYSSWCKGLTKEVDDRLLTLSVNRTGDRNPMYGVKPSKESKNARSEIMKQKILDGVFTPNSNNGNTHWDSYFRDKKFRSSWEAIYYSLHSESLYESLRIPYTYNNKEYVYIVDFINHTTKKVTEIKPKELLSVGRTPVKLLALRKWTENTMYSIQIITRDVIAEMSMKVIISDFDFKTQNKIKAMNETYKKNRDR